MLLSEFKQIISGETVFICGNATWCKPCKEFKERVEKIPRADRKLFLFFDADEDAEIIDFCAIRVFPTLQVWVDGKLISEDTGTKIDLDTLIQKYGTIPKKFNNTVLDF